jgi:hypothetical protein
MEKVQNLKGSNTAPSSKNLEINSIIMLYYRSDGPVSEVFRMAVKI